MKNKLIKLAAELEKLRLEASSIYKLAGEAEYDYLVKMNLSSINETPGPDVNKKEFYAKLKERAEDGEGIFNKDTLETMNAVNEDNIPTTNRKEFTKWLANCIQEEPETRYYMHRSLSTIKDWYMATNPNINLMTFLDAADHAENWHQQLGMKESSQEGDKYLTNEVLYTFPDGFKVVYVPAAGEVAPYKYDGKEVENTSNDRIIEGNILKLCLGIESRLYQTNAYGKIYSLRDPGNKPHVTIRVDNNGAIQEARGKANSEPTKYLKYLEELYNYTGWITREDIEAFHWSFHEMNDRQEEKFIKSLLVENVQSKKNFNLLKNLNVFSRLKLITSRFNLLSSNENILNGMIEGLDNDDKSILAYQIGPNDILRKAESDRGYYSAEKYAKTIDKSYHPVTFKGMTQQQEGKDLIRAAFEYYTNIPNTPFDVVFNSLKGDQMRLDFLNKVVVAEAVPIILKNREDSNITKEDQRNVLESVFQKYKAIAGINWPNSIEELVEEIKLNKED